MRGVRRRLDRKRQIEVEAEMDTREWTKPIPTGDYINMRNAYMKVHGKIEDKVTPSKEYLEKSYRNLKTVSSVQRPWLRWYQRTRWILM